jgi:hypothetical protein
VQLFGLIVTALLLIHQGQFVHGGQRV